jgi:lipoprotein-releasing system ATP-binding protein
MTNSPVLVASGITRTYLQGEVILPVLSGTNLTIKSGEKVAVVGVSGSGKTTLLNMLGGLDDPTEGSILVCGKVWADLGPSERASWRNKNVGFVYQFHHLLGEFTAIENVALPLLIGDCSVSEAQQRATTLLQRVGLSDRLDHLPSELSGGERQRVAVARALVTEPSIVLMDEPTGNLDPHTAKKMLDLLIDLNNTLSISFVLVTHDQNIAKKMDRTVILEGGKLVKRDNTLV